MPSPVETIKSRLGIADVVGSYIKLEKAGGNFKACCPFHNEKTPSFFVSPSRDSYHCFGCNRGGDIISFVQEIEGLEFLEALKLLADRAGVELEPLNAREKSETDRLARLLEEAVNFYRRELENNPAPKSYLLGRGLKPETLENFKIGFAPAGWRNLLDHLSRLGYKPEEVEKVGLAVPSGERGSYGNRYYDRFRSRIMFPLSNTSGKVVGFSGRLFGDEKAEAAKYINTPQTIFFDKSRVLYGYDKGKMVMKQSDYCVLVEGQVDLLMSHQSGISNTVATSGTALTEEHLKLIKRLTENLILAYDYDLAGLKASWAAINLSRKIGFNVKIAKLPSGQDPADVIKSDSAAWTKALSDASHYIDFMIDALKEEGKEGLELTLAVGRYVLPYVKALDQKMEQAHFISKIATTLGLPEQSIKEDLAKLKLEREETPSHHPSLKSGTRQDLVAERLFGLIFLLDKSPEAEEKKKEIKDLLGEEFFGKKSKAFEAARDKISLEAELLYGEPSSKLWEEAETLARVLKEEALREELQSLMSEIRRAEERKETEKVGQLLERSREISKTLNDIKAV